MYESMAQEPDVDGDAGGEREERVLVGPDEQDRDELEVLW